MDLAAEKEGCFALVQMAGIIVVALLCFCKDSLLSPVFWFIEALDRKEKETPEGRHYFGLQIPRKKRKWKGKRE